MKYNYTPQIREHLQKIKRFYSLVNTHYTLSRTFIVNEQSLKNLLSDFVANSANAIAAIQEKVASNALSELEEEGSIPLKTFSQDINSFDLNLLKQSATKVYKAIETGIQAEEIPEKTLHIVIKNFERALKNLSDAIAEFKIDIPSSLFSLGGYLENLEANYENKYDKKYWMTAYLRRWIFRPSDRLQYIRFIMTINIETDSDNSIRYALMCVVIQKILKETERSKNTSILKKLLDTGIECAEIKKDPNSFKKIGFFCEEHPSITVPESLSTYINQNRLSSRIY